VATTRPMPGGVATTRPMPGGVMPSSNTYPETQPIYGPMVPPPTYYVDPTISQPMMPPPPSTYPVQPQPIMPMTSSYMNQVKPYY
jgi:hypothetical protein